MSGTQPVPDEQLFPEFREFNSKSEKIDILGPKVWNVKWDICYLGNIHF